MSETPRPEFGREIATTADGVDITRGFTGPLLMPYDSVLRTRGANDLLIYEQVLSDPEVKATLGQRHLAVTKCETQVDAGGERRIDRQAAQFLREQIEAIGWDNVTTKMLYGEFYGYAVAENLFKPSGGRVVFDKVKVRNRRRFRYTPKGELRLLTPSNMTEGVPCDAPYFWEFRTGADNDDEPYGLGLAHWLYWPVMFKRNGLKFWLMFLEKFGMPTAVGKYDSTDSDAAERAKLLAATRAIQTDSGVIMPKGMEISLLEAARSGTADYKTLHDTMNETIQKVVLGQTASTQGTAGKLGDDTLRMEVRDDIIKAAADLVCESFNLGPARWLTQWNFPGAAIPRVYRVTEKGEDLNKLAERDKNLKDVGYRPTLARVTEVFGEGYEPAPPAPMSPATVTPPAAFAAPTPSAFPDQAALEQILDALDDGTLDAHAAGLLQPLIDLAERDPQAALDAIAGVLPDADDSALQNTLARALFTAESWGRLNA